jgi:AcrR family transcriptional regulator
MPQPDPRDTRRRILSAAAEIVASQGMAGVTFDAVAARLKMTKQAVIYWFPTKIALLSELALPGLRAEARAAIDAVAGTADPAGAGRAVVRGLISFHLSDLARFRLMYLAPQIGVTARARQTAAELVQQVHPVTSEMYGAIAAALGDGPQARETAVALHMAALGPVLMVALTEAMGDPLRHRPEALADRLASVLAAGVGVEASGKV